MEVEGLDGEGDSENCTSPVLDALETLRRRYPVDEWRTSGFFQDSFLNSIQPHWFKFDPPPANVHTIFALLFSVLMVAGMTGNLLVIVLFARCRSLRTPANYLIINLALSDFLLVCEIPIFLFNSLYRGPAIGAIGCQLYGFIGGLSGTVSIMTLAMIAIDRYYAIVHPMNPFKKTTHSRAILIIVMVWVYSLIFSSAPILSSRLHYVPEGLLTSCSFDYLSGTVESRIFIFVYFLAAWLFPLVLIVFSYLAIFRMVVKAEKFDQLHPDGSSRKTYRPRHRDNVRKELKIAVITTVIVIVWLIAWTPYAVVALLGIFRQHHLITPVISTIPACFCKTASCIDPFIYSLIHPRFQREIVKLKIVSTCVKSQKRGRMFKDTMSSQYCSATYARSEEDSINSESNMLYMTFQLVQTDSHHLQCDGGGVPVTLITHKKPSPYPKTKWSSEPRIKLENWMDGKLEAFENFSNLRSNVTRMTKLEVQGRRLSLPLLESSADHLELERRPNWTRLSVIMKEARSETTLVSGQGPVEMEQHTAAIDYSCSRLDDVAKGNGLPAIKSIVHQQKFNQLFQQTTV